jgi:2-oxoglutarate ferredoxin oxidoreductase subunit beta
VENQRQEYGRGYRAVAAVCPVRGPAGQRIETRQLPATGRQEVLFLGSAGQRIVTAGEMLCLAGIRRAACLPEKRLPHHRAAGPFRQRDGAFTAKGGGLYRHRSPSVVVALADEGVARRKKMLAQLGATPCHPQGGRHVTLPETGPRWTVDFKAAGIREPMDFAAVQRTGDAAQSRREFATKKIAPNADEWDANHHFPYKEAMLPMGSWAFSAR